MNFSIKIQIWFFYRYEKIKFSMKIQIWFFIDVKKYGFVHEILDLFLRMKIREGFPIYVCRDMKRYTHA